MSKATLVRAVLSTLVLSCLPAMASTIVPGEVVIHLGGAQLLGRDHYLVESDTIVALNVDSGPGDLLFVFAVPVDARGLVDGSLNVPLYSGKPVDGHVKEFIKIPASAEGTTFKLMAVAQDSKNHFYSSRELTVEVAGRQVLYPPFFDPANHGSVAIPVEDG